MIKVHLMQLQELLQIMVFTGEVSSAAQQFTMKTETHMMFYIGKLTVMEKELQSVF